MFTLQELLCAPPAWHSFTMVLLMYSKRSKRCMCGLGPSPEKNWLLLHGLSTAVCREDGYSRSWKETSQALCSQCQLPPLSSRHSYFKPLSLIDIVLLILFLALTYSSAFCQVCFSSVELKTGYETNIGIGTGDETNNSIGTGHETNVT